MQTILNNIEGLVSKGDKKGQANTFPDIIKNLSDLINETQKSTRSQIVELYKQFQKVLSSTLTFTFGEGTNEYLISRLIGRIYIKLMMACDMTQNQGLIDNIMSVVLSSKFKLSTKLICMATLSIILKNSRDIPSFPIGIVQDLFQSLFKACKVNQETSIRLVIINCMRLIIKMGFSINSQNTTDFMKLILRYISEKGDEVKLCCVRALLSFLNHAPYADSLSYVDQISSLCMKISDEEVTPDLKRQLAFCYTKINIIKVTKMTDPASPFHKQKHTKGNEPVDKIYELMYIFANEYAKNENLRPMMLNFIYLVFVHYKKSIQPKDVQLLIETLLTLYGKTNANYAFKNEKLMSIFFEKFSLILPQDLKFHVLSMLLEKLKSFSKADSDKKKGAVKGPALFYQILFLLKGVVALIENLGNLMSEKFQQPSVIFDILAEYLVHENIDVQITAAYCYYYLVNAYPRQRAQLTSMFLNNITLARGEIATAAPENQSKEEFRNRINGQLNTIRGSAAAISLLIRNIDFEFKSIPFDIANSVFEAAKHIITETYDGDVKKIITESAAYQSLGWTIIGELMSLEYHWVGSRIKPLFDMWKSLFYSDEIKAENEEMYKNAVYERVYAFKAVRKFTTCCKKLQTDNILKVLGTFICSFSQIIFTHLTKNPFNFTLKKGGSEITSAKLDIYRTCNLIPSSYYSGKFNLILQNAIEDVANYLSEEVFLLAKKLFPHVEYDIAYLMDFGPRYFKILFGLEDIYDMEEKKRALCDYDFSANFYSKEVVNSRLLLTKEQIIFIGNAFVSPHFINKNKMQLLKFLLSNIKACQSARDPYLKIQKLFSLLVITLAIVNKMYQEFGDKPDQVDQDSLEVFKEICESAWLYTNNHARVTCALIYAMLFKLTKSSQFQETLLKNLYDNLNDQVKSPTISAIVGYIFKFNPTLDDNFFVQVVNIFQKSTRTSGEVAAVWLVNSLRLGLEHTPNYSDALIQKCLPFLTRYHYENKESGRAFFIAWSYLIEILTKRLLSLNVGRMYHIDALIIDLDYTDFVIPDYLLKNAKVSLSCAIMNSPQIADDIKIRHTKGIVKMLGSNLYPGKLPKIPEKALDLMQQIIESGNMEYLNLFDKNFNKILIDKINRMCCKRDAKENKVDKVYNKLIKIQLELLKLKLTSFEDQLLFFKDIVFHEKETPLDKPEEEHKEKVPSRGKVGFGFEYDLTLGARTQALKAIEDLLQVTDVKSFKSKDVYNFATLVVPFVFKVASSTFDQMKEMGIKIFRNVFSKLLNYAENGEPLSNNMKEDNTPMMQQYGAQIDALIRLNIKEINDNSSATVISSIKLFNKFFKLMHKEDANMVKKLFNIVGSAVQQPLKRKNRSSKYNWIVSQSTYHSERALTEIHFSRIKVLCKTFNYFKSNMNQDKFLQEEYEHFFSPLLRKFLEQNLAAILQDSAIIVVFQRRDLRNYTGFHFIYNGTKISYDEKQIFGSLPACLTTYFILIREGLSLESALNTTSDEEMIKHLRNNAKTVPPVDVSVRSCLILLNYLLTHNEAYESFSEFNAKRQKRLYDYQAYKLLQGKVSLLQAFQAVLFDKKIIENNFDILNETLTITTHYLAMAVPTLTLEIMRIFNIFLKGYPNVDIFETICNSVASFYNSTQAIIKANVAIWAEALPSIFEVIENLIVLSLTIFTEQEQNNQQSFSYHVFYFLNLMYGQVCSGEYLIYTEASKAIRRTFEKIFTQYKGNNAMIQIAKICHSKFGFFLLSKLTADNVTDDIKALTYDLLFKLEEICDRLMPGEKDNIYLELINVTVLNCRLFKNYLLYLRTIWKNTRQIDQEVMPYLVRYAKVLIIDIREKSSLSTEENEFIVELFKVLFYLYFEGKQVNKGVLAGGILGLLLLTTDMRLDPQAFAILAQLMQHLFAQVQAYDVKDFTQTLSDDDKGKLYKIVPSLKNLIDQAQSIPTTSSQSQNTAAGGKATIQLKTFGFKKK